MQAIILAAGQSSRFIPFTSSFFHKSLVRIMGKTVLEHTLISCQKAGITKVVLVVNKKEPFEEALKENTLKIKITYVLLPQPLGMGAALLAAKEYLEDQFFLLNANHVDIDEFASGMLFLKKTSDTVVLLGKEDAGYDKYGYLQFSSDKVIRVFEKPQEEIPLSLRIIGIYLLTKKFIQTLEKMPADHYNFEMALDSFAKENEVFYHKTDKETITLKYVWDLLSVKNYLLSRIPLFISQNANVSSHAVICGNVCIEDGAKIMEGACIKGPAFIGKNAFIGTNSLVRNGTIVENDAVVGSYMEMKNVLIMENSTTHTGVIEDSVIGRNCRIAAGIITANVRLDRKTIKTTVKDERVDTCLRFLGMILGENTNIGVGVTTMPGVIIGENALIGPSTTIMKNIPGNTKYYTKFSDIIEEEIK